MQIEARHLVMWVLATLGDRPNGKTYLQKLCFFVGRVLNQEFGYRAHYYGPYSDQIASEIGFLNANDYIYESRKGSSVPDGRGWEVTRFDYRLSERGVIGVGWLDQQHSEQSKAVRAAVESILAAGELNYIGLSLAAKTFWILTDEGKPMTFEGISEKANQFKWTVSGDDVRKATDFLGKLDLASVSPPQP
jgi:uncharacterized protein YwgA